MNSTDNIQVISQEIMIDIEPFSKSTNIYNIICNTLMNCLIDITLDISLIISLPIPG